MEVAPPAPAPADAPVATHAHTAAEAEAANPISADAMPPGADPTVAVERGDATEVRGKE